MVLVHEENILNPDVIRYVSVPNLLLIWHQNSNLLIKRKKNSGEFFERKLLIFPPKLKSK